MLYSQKSQAINILINKNAVKLVAFVIIDTELCFNEKLAKDKILWYMSMKRRKRYILSTDCIDLNLHLIPINHTY